MSGSFWKQGERYIVGWYYDDYSNGIKKRKQAKIGYYKGEKIYHESIARKCLAQIQGRWEDHLQGLCHFRIEEFTGKGWTDVIEFYEQWLHEVVEPKRKPATIKGYHSYLKNWIKPFFEQNPVRMHEIQLDTLNKLLNSITLSGKGKQNVMMALHSMMDYAWRSRRIPEMPPFPKREDYNIVEPTIKWISEERQMAIIKAIPEIHRPIFLWLKYHLRRPSEACALRKEDCDVFNQLFYIRQTLSARRVVGSTKTGVEHIIPCHSDFKPYIKTLLQTDGPFMFVNPRARKCGSRYSNESLNRLWKKAAEAVDEKIDLYSGLKHSSCSQYINEKGLSIYELQIITDHKRLDSVKRYAKVEVARKRALMERSTKNQPKTNIMRLKR